MQKPVPKMVTMAVTACLIASGRLGDGAETAHSEERHRTGRWRQRPSEAWGKSQLATLP